MHVLSGLLIHLFSSAAWQHQRAFSRGVSGQPGRFSWAPANFVSGIAFGFVLAHTLVAMGSALDPANLDICCASVVGWAAVGQLLQRLMQHQLLLEQLRCWPHRSAQHRQAPRQQQQQGILVSILRSAASTVRPFGVWGNVNVTVPCIKTYYQQSVSWPTAGQTSTVCPARTQAARDRTQPPARSMHACSLGSSLYMRYGSNLNRPAVHNASLVLLCAAAATAGTGCWSSRCHAAPPGAQRGLHPWQCWPQQHGALPRIKVSCRRQQCSLMNWGVAAVSGVAATTGEVAVPSAPQ